MCSFLKKFRFYSLTQRFFLTYLLVVLLPTLLFGKILYSNTLRQLRTELINTEKEALLSDRYYLENQLKYIEEKYNQFNVSSGLADILNQNASTSRSIMYTYVKDVASLIKSNQYYNPYIDRIDIYTNNSTAVEILPEFLPMAQLYGMNISEDFASNPQRELFRQFWLAQDIDGELKLIFLGGFLNSMYSEISGVLSITCNSQLFNLFLNDQADDTSTYIFWDKKLIHAFNDNDKNHEILTDNEEFIRNSSGDVNVSLNTRINIILCIIRLTDYNMTIVQVKKPMLKSFVESPIFTSMFICALLFLISNIILFPLVYRPFRNITLLARHMKQTNSHILIPYSGPASNDEVGNLIAEYNFMVERTNNMSEMILKKEELLRNAQIDALQSQLNPHFFYGTLESIRMIAEMKNETLIADIAYAFGNLMRYSLSREYFVPLQKEIEVVKQYIEIQNKRFMNRFSVEWHTDKFTDEWICPKFALLFMVDNAIVHNVPKTRQKIHIDIDIIQFEDNLSISVINDGPGISKERLEELRFLLEHPEERSGMSSKHNGRGIFNINDMLKLYYGKDYYLSISSEENVKTTCNIRIPLKNKKTAEELPGGDKTC